MMNVLGGTDTVTGASDPWTHTVGLKNTTDGQPTSWTLSLFNGAETWQMAGSQLAQAEYEIPAEGAATASYQWLGLPAVKVSNPTNTPGTAKPWAGWNTTITLGGTAQSVYSSCKFSYKRETAPIHTADGTQSPYLIFVGPLTVTGELVSVYQGHVGAPTDLANYLANTQLALVVQVNPVGDATHFGKWTHTTVAYDDVEVSGSAGKWMEASAKWEAIANSTDAIGGGQAPGKFQLATTVSAAY
jgi:hypothetical protein